MKKDLKGFKQYILNLYPDLKKYKIRINSPYYVDIYLTKNKIVRCSYCSDDFSCNNFSESGLQDLCE